MVHEHPHTEHRHLLTTGEVAEYLRIKERTVYDLVARDAIPHTRATGKLLFFRRLIDDWLESQTVRPPGMVESRPPMIYAGSNDPLLEWAIRQSGSGLAVLAGGSTSGLQALADHRAMLAGCHLREPQTGVWNLAAVHAALPPGGHVVIHWAKRTQGLLLTTGNPHAVTDLSDAARKGLRFALRVDGAGSTHLLHELLTEACVDSADLDTAPQRAETHADLVALIQTGQADCGLGLQAVADGLAFIPLLADEHFDLVMSRHAYFEPPIQALLSFARSGTFERRALHLGGYDTSELGAVRWNGPGGAAQMLGATGRRLP